jgi:hypothetical protein
MFNSINQTNWSLSKIYSERVNEGNLLVADRLTPTLSYDLSTADGATMLRQFKRVTDCETATAWIDKYGFPWVADQMHFDDIGLENGVLLEDMIERAVSLSLFSRLVAIAKGKSKFTCRDILAWPVASSPLANGKNILLSNSWRDIPAGTKLNGREAAKDFYLGRLSTNQDLAVAFVSDKKLWCGKLTPPLFKAVESVEEAVLSGVDFVPIFVASEVGAKGFEAVVRYAASELVAELLPRLIRGIVPTVGCDKTASGELALNANFIFPTPFSLMAYELYKGIPRGSSKRSY